MYCSSLSGKPHSFHSEFVTAVPLVGNLSSFIYFQLHCAWDSILHRSCWPSYIDTHTKPYSVGVGPSWNSTKPREKESQAGKICFGSHCICMLSVIGYNLDIWSARNW